MLALAAAAALSFALTTASKSPAAAPPPAVALHSAAAASVATARASASSGAISSASPAASLSAGQSLTKKVVYGALPKETVRALFDGYRAAQGRNYSSPAELERRFGVFKTNLAFIDRLNAHNPHAIFGLTRFVDRTEEERARMRMSTNVTTSWSSMKSVLAALDGALVAAAEDGPDAVAALSAARKEAKAEAATDGSSFTDSSAAITMDSSSLTTGGDHPNNARMSTDDDDGNDGISVSGTESNDDDGSRSWEDGTAFDSDRAPDADRLDTQGAVPWVDVEDCAACSRYPHFSEYTQGNLPTNFDWRSLGAVSDVKNQAYCGSCWSFSAAADLEGTTFLRDGALNSLSNQQLVSCSTRNFGCGGGYPFFGLQYAQHSGGLVTWDEWPYEALCMEDACDDGPGDIYTGTPTCDVSLVDAVVKSGQAIVPTGWQMVAMGPSYEELLRVALVKNGPISIVLNANGMDFYEHGVIGCASRDCEAGEIEHAVPCDPDDLDHAVLIVGYGVEADDAFSATRRGSGGDGDAAAAAGLPSASRRRLAAAHGDDLGASDAGASGEDGAGDDGGNGDSSSGTPYWVIKNSWGDEWGEDGYYRVVRGKNHCGVANFAVHSVLTAPTASQLG